MTQFPSLVLFSSSLAVILSLLWPCSDDQLWSPRLTPRQSAMKRAG